MLSDMVEARLEGQLTAVLGVKCKVKKSESGKKFPSDELLIEKGMVSLEGDKYKVYRKLGVDTSSLSFREKQILKMITEGYSNKKISSVLNVKQSTVSTFVKSLLTKCKVSGRSQLCQVVYD